MNKSPRRQLLHHQLGRIARWRPMTDASRAKLVASAARSPVSATKTPTK